MSCLSGQRAYPSVRPLIARERPARCESSREKQQRVSQIDISPSGLGERESLLVLLSSISAINQPFLKIGQVLLRRINSTMLVVAGAYK